MQFVIKNFFNVILLMICFPISLIIVLISNFYLIRFGMVFGEKIGHFSADTEAYLLRKKKSNIKSIDFITVTKNICNKSLLKLWKQKFFIFQNRKIILSLLYCCRIISKSNKHTIKLFANYEDYYLFNNYSSSIEFEEKDKEDLVLFFKNYNLDKNSNFICIHNRDNSYHKNNLAEIDLSYHSHRNFGINNLVDACKEIIEKNYSVIRMGQETSTTIRENKNIIDYSKSNLKSEILDLILISKCKFYVGCDSGLWGVALLFRKPIVWTNIASIKNLQIINYSPLFFIFKHFYSLDLKRNLSIQELHNENLLDLDNEKKLKEKNIKLIENTKDEIEEIIYEMFLFQNNLATYSEEDTLKQNLFWKKLNKFLPINKSKYDNFRIGKKFLNNNLYLIK